MCLGTDHTCGCIRPEVVVPAGPAQIRLDPLEHRLAPFAAAARSPRPLLPSPLVTAKGKHSVH
jgi:hypothetical protein